MRRKRKIFDSLVRNYIFFSLTVGICAFLLLLFFTARTDERIPGKELSRLRAAELISQSNLNIPLETIADFHGWVEILNEQRQVIEVHGDKLDSPYAYSEEAMNRLLYDLKENLYYTSITPYLTKEGQSRYYMVKLPKSKVVVEVTVNLSTAENRRIFWRTSLETGVLFLLLFGLNVYVYSRFTAVRITNPLSAIAAGIRSVAVGRYYERLHFKANYELSQIQENFNLMAERLDKAETGNRLLEESKQRMLVHISHDLKTPITTIQGYAKALQLGMIEEEAKKQRTINLIYDKSQLVTELIDDVFELSKLESPDYPLTKKPADIAEFVRQIAVDYYEQFEDQHFRFEYDIPAQEVTTAFNAKLLYRAVSNLLANALKYNAAGTEVRIALKEARGQVSIEIADNGIGIAEHLQDKVFDAFVRGDAARKSDGGTGLGLTIAKHIVEKHGGSLCLETGCGWTRFLLVLPESSPG